MALQALKERLVERANIIQARHDAETAALVKRQVCLLLLCFYHLICIWCVLVLKAFADACCRVSQVCLHLSLTFAALLAMHLVVVCA